MDDKLCRVHTYEGVVGEGGKCKTENGKLLVVQNRQGSTQWVSVSTTQATTIYYVINPELGLLSSPLAPDKGCACWVCGYNTVKRGTVAWWVCGHKVTD